MKIRVKKGECFIGPLAGPDFDALTDHDKSEVRKFAQWLHVQATRKSGDALVDTVLDCVEAALYPDECMSREPKGDA